MSEDLKNIFRVAGFDKVDEKIANDINKIVDWQHILQQVDVKGVEPMYSTVDERENIIMNEDIIEQTEDNIFANTTECSDGYFCVPKVIKN